jgi:hypothetical protein
LEQDLRRAPRVVSDLLVHVAGVDDHPVQRRCDVSLTGIFFELDRQVGGAGSVQWMRLATLDRRHTVEIMGRIIRTMSMDDVAQPEARFGIAFEFMPDSSARYNALQELVRAVLRDAAAREAQAAVESRDLPKAAVFHPRISRMHLEANWPVRSGEIVQVVFRSPGTQTRIPFEGQVTAVERTMGLSSPSFLVEVELSAPGVRAPGSSQSSSSISESVDLIFNVLLDEAGEKKKKEPSQRKEHLVGLLSRINITSLFALFEMERVSGEMRLTHEDKKVYIYVREGAIVDARRTDTNAGGREALRGITSWKEGAFDFTYQDVDRADRIGTSTTALLLDLAREEDELDR